MYFYEDILDGEPPIGGEIVEYSLNPNFPNSVFHSPRASSVRVLSKAVPINQHRKGAYGTD